MGIVGAAWPWLPLRQGQGKHLGLGFGDTGFDRGTSVMAASDVGRAIGVWGVRMRNVQVQSAVLFNCVRWPCQSLTYPSKSFAVSSWLYALHALAPSFCLFLY